MAVNERDSQNKYQSGASYRRAADG